MHDLSLAAPWLLTASSVFSTTLTGLAFETIPFLLIGTLVSSIIHVFVPDQVLRRLFPRNRILSILVALGVGFFLPICECSTVPIARRLRDKGLPLSTAAAFLLAAPLANPMTIISTYFAFKGGPYPMYLLRLGVGLGTAFLIALIVEFSPQGRSPVSAPAPSRRFRRVGVVPPLRRAPGLAKQAPRPALRSQVARTLEHCSREFLDSGRYLIAGISAAALVRALLPADILSHSMENPLGALGAGAVSAFLLSLCSSADAFVARSLFVPNAYPAALVFLILGPMIDLKNSILLARFLDRRLLISFIALIFILCLGTAIVVSPFLGVRP